jgi:hypothetical protein
VVKLVSKYVVYSAAVGSRGSLNPQSHWRAPETEINERIKNIEGGIRRKGKNRWAIYATPGSFHH